MGHDYKVIQEKKKRKQFPMRQKIVIHFSVSSLEFQSGVAFQPPQIPITQLRF